MFRLLRWPALLLAFFSLAAAQDSPVVLTVRLENAPALAFTAAQLAALPHVDLTAANPHEKKEHRYSGVPVREFLARAGAPLGEKLRGKARSKDGYGVLFALAEFDETFSGR